MEDFYQRRDNFFSQILHKFPEPQVIIGYGSGVFPQSGHSSHRMIDMILIVDNIRQFHETNFKMNPDHYKKNFQNKSELIISLNQRLFPLYFFTQNEFEGVEYKYGVASLTALERDIKQWDILSLAGRLQKPVLLVKNNVENLMSLMQHNYESAVK